MLPFRSLVSSDQLTPTSLQEIFNATDHMKMISEKHGRSALLADKVVALLFYEPSSRTMLSFQSAAQRLHAGVIFAQSQQESSLKKGESIEDAMRVISGYCDLIVMRHPEPGSAARAAGASAVPFINGGDGKNEHPTQAIIDAYTIWSELGTLEGLHIGLGFDPLQSRSIHSFTTLLSLYSGVEFTFISPEALRCSRVFLKKLRDRGAKCNETDSLEVVSQVDVLYLNRLQEERFEDHREFENIRHSMRLTREVLGAHRPLILDPLPRVDEISSDVDAVESAKYFLQSHNGVPVRMALLSLLLRGSR